MISEIRRKADRCIEMLSLYLRLDMSSGQIFRTLVDDWFAYSKGPPFLNKNDNPIWFNNPDPSKDQCRKALLSMDYISIEANRLIFLGERGLVKDHAIPLKKLESLLKELPDQNKNSAGVRIFLEGHYRLGVLTQTEHQQLNGRLKAEMPEDWDGLDLRARYKAVDIKLL